MTIILPYLLTIRGTGAMAEPDVSGTEANGKGETYPEKTGDTEQNYIEREFDLLKLRRTQLDLAEEIHLNKRNLSILVEASEKRRKTAVGALIFLLVSGVVTIMLAAFAVSDIFSDTAFIALPATAGCAAVIALAVFIIFAVIGISDRRKIENLRKQAHELIIADTENRRQIENQLRLLGQTAVDLTIKKTEAER